MAPHLTIGEKRIIYKFYMHFKREAERERLFRSVDKFAQRVLDVVGLSRSTLFKLVGDVQKAGFENNSKHERRKKIDDFDMQVVVRTAYEFFDRNETLTVKRLNIALRESHDIYI